MMKATTTNELTSTATAVETDASNGFKADVSKETEPKPHTLSKALTRVLSDLNGLTTETSTDILEDANLSADPCLNEVLQMLQADGRTVSLEEFAVALLQDEEISKLVQAEAQAQKDDKVRLIIGLDVHKDSYAACTYNPTNHLFSNEKTISPSWKGVAAYIKDLEKQLGEGDKLDVLCAYEAGCLGYTLYRDLTKHGIDCLIVAPSTIPKDVLGKVRKNDHRDARDIAKGVAHETVSFVAPPTEEDEAARNYIRMRASHVEIRKTIKQQINSFCLRLGHQYPEKSHWTLKHLDWLRKLEFPEVMDRQTLDRYMTTYEQLTECIKECDVEINRLSETKRFKDIADRIQCLKGVRVYTAMGIITEVGDFSRFQTATDFAAYLGLLPGEHSSGAKQQNLGITKTGNIHVRKLLVEAAQTYGRGSDSTKSKVVAKRQKGQPSEVIAYADKGNRRLNKRARRMTLEGKKTNIVKTAIAREIACFIWGLATGKLSNK